MVDAAPIRNSTVASNRTDSGQHNRIKSHRFGSAWLIPQRSEPAQSQPQRFRSARWNPHTHRGQHSRMGQSPHMFLPSQCVDMCPLTVLSHLWHPSRIYSSTNGVPWENWSIKTPDLSSESTATQQATNGYVLASRLSIA
jgi:hypothetical protein